MNAFEVCHKINDLFESHQDNEARNELIKLLDYLEKENIEYTPLINHLIRQAGLYPYLKTETASWQERFIFESFKADIGSGELATLHRDQSLLLRKLLSGESIAVSAPTSFGKSFVIDSFISIQNPENVAIIVPTIALTDETRRRLHKKFSTEYKIITTSDQQLADKNIFIFPQERAIGYVNNIQDLDILIIDEFYKASDLFDKDRAPSLLRAILRLGEIAKQKYFLAPNINSLQGSVFTQGMEFFSLDFNTVYLEENKLFEEIGRDELKKSNELLRILGTTGGKSLIYAGTYTNISKLANLLISHHEPIQNKLLKSFSKWLAKNYDPNWNLTNLIDRGTGIHNGQLHRSLSQIQIKLFEEPEGIKNLISTSSIIEGVNTSAENVILWSNKNGRPKLNNFTYKNIIGRGGRMFKHFIGKIFILEEPPKDEETQLELTFPDELLGDLDDASIHSHNLTEEQIEKTKELKEEMNGLIGEQSYNSLKKEGTFQNSNSYLLLEIAKNMKYSPRSWNGLGYLNSPDPDNWDRFLYKIMRLQSGGWGIEYSKFVAFVKILSLNWDQSIPELLASLDKIDIGVEDFFKLERIVTFKLSSLLHDVNVIQKEILKDTSADITSFVSKTSHAFLPKVAFQLEEYGLPRNISKKIHQAEIIDFLNEDLDLYMAIEKLNEVGISSLIRSIGTLDEFDKYILIYFYDGISSDFVSN